VPPLTGFSAHLSPDFGDGHHQHLGPGGDRNAKKAGYSAAFLALAPVATARLVLFWLAMPETKDINEAAPFAAPRLRPASE
jgi:hypothetical protein